MQAKEELQRCPDVVDRLRDPPPDSNQEKNPRKELPQVEGWQQRQSLHKPDYWQNKKKQKRNQRISHYSQGLHGGEQETLSCNLYLQQYGEIKMHVVSGKGKMEVVVFGWAVRVGQRQRWVGLCFGR